jgi:hypothetical protein
VSLHTLFQAGATSCCLILILTSRSPCLSVHTVKPGKLDGIKTSSNKWFAHGGPPTTMMMSNIPSPWRYDSPTSTRETVSNTRQHAIRDRAHCVFFQCHDRLDRRALNHPRINVRCRGKLGMTILRASISQFDPTETSTEAFRCIIIALSSEGIIRSGER